MENESSLLTSVIITVLPLVLLALLAVPLLRVVRRSARSMDRAAQHMDRVEEQNARIIALLERLADRRGTEADAARDPRDPA